jgi:hypothetical protein
MRIRVAAVLALGLTFTLAVGKTGSADAADLSTLTFDDRRNIETACILTRANGPVAYNNCVNHHLSELRSAEPVAVTGSDAARSGALAPRFSAMPPVSPTVPAAPL